MHLGLPELLVVLGIGSMGLIPLAVGVWSLVVLLQMRSCPRNGRRRSKRSNDKFSAAPRRRISRGR